MWHFHQERNCRTARTSPHHSFLPISCGFPTDVTIPNVPPQLKQILSVLSWKSADSQHKGEPISARGHRSTASGVARCQVMRHQATSHQLPPQNYLTKINVAQFSGKIVQTNFCVHH